VNAQLTALRRHLGEISDLQSIAGLLFWDQQTMMPPAGALNRGDSLGTLARVIHARETDPMLARLLDALEPWAAEQDPDSDDARLIFWTRRDFEKAVRVPEDLAAEMTKAKALGQHAWLEARAANDFKPFRAALAHHVELRHRYVACFTGFDHPYDVLLDDFEPGLTIAELRPLFAELRDALVPLVAAAGNPDQPRNDGAFQGEFDAEAQRVAVLDVLEAVGFDPDSWRLDPTLHPFASGGGIDDIRITTHYEPGDLDSLFATMHEYGHGLYEHQVAAELDRGPLASGVSLGLHESQSRMWENLVGRSLPFWRMFYPRLQEKFAGALGGIDLDAFYRSVNQVQPSLIRIHADEVTYNMHIILRFELEQEIIGGRVALADLPEEWNRRMWDYLGIEVPDDAHGVLQDVHWSGGSMGYFPTYTLGNVMSVQIWERLREDLPELDEQVERGEFAPLREWLGEHLHRHGRKYTPEETLAKVVGGPIETAPYLRYLRDKHGVPAA